MGSDKKLTKKIELDELPEMDEYLVLIGFSAIRL
jgi:hypothetical protein